MWSWLCCRATTALWPHLPLSAGLGDVVLKRAANQHANRQLHPFRLSTFTYYYSNITAICFRCLRASLSHTPSLALTAPYYAIIIVHSLLH